MTGEPLSDTMIKILYYINLRSNDNITCTANISVYSCRD